MNWVDSPLIVYSLVPDHPAQALLATELRLGRWGSTVYVLLEVFTVLTRDYSVPRARAIDGINGIASSGIEWADLPLVSVLEGLMERGSSTVESADALLLALARRDGGTVVTPDRRLLMAARAHGISARNPITLPFAIEIARWEDTELAPKGMPRALRAIERWLRNRDAELATQFIEATDHLTILPR